MKVRFLAVLAVLATALAILPAYAQAPVTITFATIATGDTIEAHDLPDHVLQHSSALIAVATGTARPDTVTDWNQTAIDFYRSIGADLLEEWRICRITGEGLERLAASDRPAGPE